MFTFPTETRVESEANDRGEDSVYDGGGARQARPRSETARHRGPRPGLSLPHILITQLVSALTLSHPNFHNNNWLLVTLYFIWFQCSVSVHRNA